MNPLEIGGSWQRIVQNLRAGERSLGTGICQQRG